jgi:hypothetical protein
MVFSATIRESLEPLLRKFLFWNLRCKFYYYFYFILKLLKKLN